MPFTHSMATRWSKVLTEVRKSDEFGGCDLMANHGLPSNTGRRLMVGGSQKIYTVVISIDSKAVQQYVKKIKSTTRGLHHRRVHHA
jgi:hypothetical protein